MPTDNLLRVRHILDAAEKAVFFLLNKTKPDLEKDEQLALSLVRLLEIVGEATNMTSEDFRSRYPLHFENG